MGGPAIDAASIAGVVLAGGRGARMGGVDKGWVAYRGKALIAQVIARLQPQVGAIVISANRNLERYRALGYPVVADAAQDDGARLGPLAGMLAGLRAVQAPWVAFVPCDAPALPAALVANLARAAAPDGRPALACCAGRRQPVFCLMPAALAGPLGQALQRGERRPDDFLRHVDAIEVSFDDALAFANVNTPGDAADVPPGR